MCVGRGVERSTWFHGSVVSELLKMKVVEIGFVLKITCCLRMLHCVDSLAELTVMAKTTTAAKITQNACEVVGFQTQRGARHRW